MTRTKTIDKPKGAISAVSSITFFFGLALVKKLYGDLDKVNITLIIGHEHISDDLKGSLTELATQVYGVNEIIDLRPILNAYSKEGRKTWAEKINPFSKGARKNIWDCIWRNLDNPFTNKFDLLILRDPSRVPEKIVLELVQTDRVERIEDGAHNWIYPYRPLSFKIEELRKNVRSLIIYCIASVLYHPSHRILLRRYKFPKTWSVFGPNNIAKELKEILLQYRSLQNEQREGNRYDQIKALVLGTYGLGLIVEEQARIYDKAIQHLKEEYNLTKDNILFKPHQKFKHLEGDLPDNWLHDARITSETETYEMAEILALRLPNLKYVVALTSTSLFLLKALFNVEPIFLISNKVKWEKYNWLRALINSAGYRTIQVDNYPPT